MKKVIFMIGLLTLVGCSSIRVVDSWKNKEISNFNPNKVLVIGVTDNLTARTIFEDELVSQMKKRGMNAVQSVQVLDANFTNTKKNEEEIQQMISGLSDQGFDAVLISAVKGVDTNRNYADPSYSVGYRWTRFGRYYYRYQDVYFHPGYYNQYKVFHVETSLYSLDSENEKSLVWVGSLDLVDPKNIRTTVNQYVAAIMSRLEKDKVIGVIQ